MIEVHSLSKSFGSLSVLSNVSFSAEPGDRIRIDGANGSGKSTLLRCIAGDLIADEGRVVIDGVNPWTSRVERDRTVVLVSESGAVFSGLQTGEIVKTYGRNFDKRGEWVSRLVEDLGLAPVLHRDCAVLSKGYARRLELFMAMVRRPPVLLLDEPLDGIDASSVDRIRKLTGGYTDGIIVYVDHVDELPGTTHRYRLTDGALADA